MIHVDDSCYNNTCTPPIKKRKRSEVNQAGAINVRSCTKNNVDSSIKKNHTETQIIHTRNNNAVSTSSSIGNNNNTTSTVNHLLATKKRLESNTNDRTTVTTNCKNETRKKKRKRKNDDYNNNDVNHDVDNNNNNKDNMNKDCTQEQHDLDCSCKVKKKTKKKRKRQKTIQTIQPSNDDLDPHKIQKNDGTNEIQVATTANSNNANDNNNNKNGLFPFLVEPDDHCESPMVAYQDIVPLLEKLNAIVHTNNKKTNNKNNRIMDDTFIKVNNNNKNKNRATLPPLSLSSTTTTPTTTASATIATSTHEHQSPKRSFELYIYDPYYCDGTMKRHLNELGFYNVYHTKEDCYRVWDSSTTTSSSTKSDHNNQNDGSTNTNKDTPPPTSCYPNPLDVLITNPPYSGNHIEKLIEHVTSPDSPFFATKCSSTTSSRAWFLLLPVWVHKKEYYINAMQQYNIQPFYIVPTKRYVYVPPKQFRPIINTKSHVHRKSSPFPSMWYCYGGNDTINEQLIQHFYNTSNNTNNHNLNTNKNRNMKTPQPQCYLARTKSALRDLRRKVG